FAPTSVWPTEETRYATVTRDRVAARQSLTFEFATSQLSTANDCGGWSRFSVDGARGLSAGASVRAFSGCSDNVLRSAWIGFHSPWPGRSGELQGVGCCW